MNLTEDQIVAMVAEFARMLRAEEITQIHSQAGMVRMDCYATNMKRFKPTGGREVRITVGEGPEDRSAACDCEHCREMFLPRR